MIEGPPGATWSGGFRAVESDAIKRPHVDHIFSGIFFEHLHIKHQGKDRGWIQVTEIIGLTKLVESG